MNRHLYEWLKDYKELMEQIDYLEFNLEVTESELRRWQGGDLSKVFLVKDSKGSQVEEKILQITNELAIKRDQVNKLIELVSKFNSLEQKILKMKYINNMTLESIAYELDYSNSYIYKKHAEAMRLIRFAEVQQNKRPGGELL